MYYAVISLHKKYAIDLNNILKKNNCICSLSSMNNDCYLSPDKLISKYGLPIKSYLYLKI